MTIDSLNTGDHLSPITLKSNQINIVKMDMIRFQISNSLSQYSLLWKYLCCQLSCVVCLGQSKLRRNVTLVC